MELPISYNDVTSIVSNNPIASVLGAGVVGTGVALGTVAIVKSVSRKSRTRKSKVRASRKRSSTRRHKKRKLKFGSKAYRKKYLGKKRKSRHFKVNKNTSHRKIRYTKNNQPYIILSSGKARFIKKSSASRSRKLKGGRY